MIFLCCRNVTSKDSITISVWNHRKLHKESSHSGFLGCVHLSVKSINRLKDAGPQLMTLVRATSNDSEPVRGQIAVSLMSRETTSTAMYRSIPVVAIVDRLGNVSCGQSSSPTLEIGNNFSSCHQQRLVHFTSVSFFL